MKNVKKWLAFMLTLCMALSLVACAPTSNDDDPQVNLLSMSEKDHLAYLINQELNQVLGNLSTTYEVPESLGMDTTVGLRLGDSLKEMLGQNIFKDATALDFLNTITMDCDVDMKGDLTKLVMDLAMNGSDIGTVDFMMNTTDTTMWIGFPGLADKYATMNLMDLLTGVQTGNVPQASPSPYGTASSAASAATPMWMQLMPELLEALPNAETLKSMVNGYVKAAVNALDNVKRETKTVELDGLKQELTCLTITVTEKTLDQVGLAIMKKAKDDTQLKDILQDVEEILNDATGESTELYDSFLEAVEESIEYIESRDEDDYADDSGNVVITLNHDDTNAITGMSVITNDDDEPSSGISFQTVTQGNAYNVEAKLVTVSYSAHWDDDLDEPVYDYTENIFSFTGGGTIKDGKKDGTFALTATVGEETMTFANFTLKNFMANQDATTGSLTIDPSAQILRNFGLPAEADLSLELIWDMNNTTSNVTINLNLNDMLMAGIDISFKERTAGIITEPSGAIDITDETSLNQWISGIDLDALADNLIDAGVPSNYFGQ